MLTEAPTAAPTETTQPPSPAADSGASGSAGGPGGDGGGGGDDDATALITVVVVAAFLVLGIVLGAIVYVKMQAAAVNADSRRAGGFENPLYATTAGGEPATGAGGAGNSGYMDVPMSQNPEHAAAGESFGGFGADVATGYMDVAPVGAVTGAADDEEEDV